MGRWLRKYDHLGLLTGVGYFHGIFCNLRVEYRVQIKGGVWTAWEIKELVEQRRAWHWLVNPWITEDRVLTMVIRRLLDAGRSNVNLARPVMTTFHDRMLFHILTRTRIDAVALDVIIRNGDSDCVMIHVAAQNIAFQRKLQYAT